MQILKRSLLLSSSLAPIAQRLLVTFIAAGNLLGGAISTSTTRTAASSTTCTPADQAFASTCRTSNTNSMSEPAAETYTAGSSSVAFVTTPNENLAKKLARGLVENKLAACVNIVPQIQSIYMWEGKVNEDNECLMMIKTRTSRVDALVKWVRENHSYSVAEVITLPIENGNAPYLSWIAQTVPDKE